MSWEKVRVILPQTRERSFRDPCAWMQDGVCHLYYTLVQNEEDGQYFYVAESISSDMNNWSEPRILTERGKQLNYSSPGNVFCYQGLFYMCLQTYPRENGEIYGNQNSRIFLMKSPDLQEWSEPELLRVKGEVSVQKMGRMIDPYIVCEEERILCFYKQNGVSFSESADLIHWHYKGNTACGENVCIHKEDGYYYIFHSPENGIGLLRTKDLKKFEDCGCTTLGQEHFAWAKDRITAGFLMQKDGRSVLFFHGDNEDKYRFGASIAMIEDWDWKECFLRKTSFKDGVVL